MLTAPTQSLSQFPNEAIKNHDSHGKIAYSGLLERIHFEQWHVFAELRKLTKNIDLINYASLLAVFPRMGFYAYRISQSEMAEKTGLLFGGRVPARNTISKWENELQRIGLLEIPRHVDWANSKTKIRIFTEKFWNISRRGLPFLSYTRTHVTFWRGSVERVGQYKPTVNHIDLNEIRAREQTETIALPDTRAASPVKNEQNIRPPKYNNARMPKNLSKFENSFCWWLFQSKSLDSYRDGVVLFSRFLELPQNDDYLSQLRRNWMDCGDAARPGLVSETVKFLRTLDAPVIIMPPVRIANPQPPKNGMADPDKALLLKSLIDGIDYQGKYRNIFEYFRNATESTQIWIVRNIDQLIRQSSSADRLSVLSDFL